MAGQCLVGRDAELRAAEVGLDRLAEGFGGLLLITGEPGIGKSALAEAVLDDARARGARTSWATAWQHAGAPPLWPWIQTLRQLDLDTAVLDPVTAARTDEADAARFRQFEAVDAALADHLADGPVAVVLDDLQWADVTTLRLLAFLVGTSRRRPFLVVGTCRPDELGPGELAALDRLATTTLALGGLDGTAVNAMLVDAVGEDRGNRATAVVAARSGGNPLFIREFARLLAVSDRTGLAERAVPPGVAAVIQRRLARQSDQVMHVLQGGAVLGRRFDPSMLAGLLDPSADVGPCLDAAERAGLLVTLRTGDREFAHDVLLDVVRDSLSPDQAERLHARAADLLIEPVRHDPSLHARVATHLDRAGRAGEAAEHWRAAGDWALGVLAYEEAAGCFAKARRLSGAARATDLLLAEADARLRAGELATARELFAEAATQAGRAGDVHRLATAVLGMGAGVTGWEVPMSDAAYVRLVSDALELVPENEVRLRAALLARLSVARATPETQAESRALATDALVLASEVGDQVLEAQALAALCDASAGPAYVAQRRVHAERIVALGQQAGDRGIELLGRRFAVVALLEAGELAAVDREIGAFQQLAESLRQPLLAWYAPLFRGMRALLRGNVEEADRYVAEVAAAAERTGSTNASMLASTLLIGIRAQTGRPIPRDLFEGTTDIDPAAWSSYASCLAFLAAHDGDLVEAGRMLHLHSDNGFARIGDDAELLATLRFFGVAAVAVADEQAAAWLYDAFSPYTGLWIVDGIAAVCWGPVELELGRLAGALGRTEEARRHLVAAREQATAVGAPLLLAEIERLEGAVGVVPPVESGSGVWLREGGLWSLTYAGSTVRVRDAKGLADLARLLARPGREVHVLDLLGDGAAHPAEGPSGEVLDTRARQAYRDRLAELEEEIDEAILDADRGRVERAQEEKEFLLAELSAAVGLGGRSRRLGEPAERARKAVTTRVRLTIERIAEVHPALAAHLRNSVRTGTFCSYQPEIPTTWQLRTGDATPDVAPQG